MAVRERVERRFAGFGDNGERREYVTYTGQPLIESVADWVEVTAARLRAAAPGPLAEVAVALLQADGDAALRAAVGSAGRRLDEWQRWGVRRLLDRARQQAADTYGPAVGLAERVCGAWTARWGEQKPRPVSLAGEDARAAGRALVRGRLA